MTGFGPEWNGGPKPGMPCSVRLTEWLGVSLQAGTTDDFSGSKYIDPESAATDPVLDGLRRCERLGAHVLSHDRAWFAQLNAIQFYVANGELGVEELIQSDASGDDVSPCD